MYLKYYVVLFSLWAVILFNPSGFLFEDDEGAYLYVSQAVAEGSSLYSDIMAAKPPMIFVLGSLIYKLWGNNIIAFRYIASFCGLISLLFIFQIFVKRIGAPAATIVSAIFLFDPLVFTQMRLFRTDIFMLTFIIGGLYFLMRKKGRRDTILASVLFGLSVYTRDDAIFMHFLFSHISYY